MLAQYIDSTNLKNDGTYQDIVNLCNDAVQYNMAAVCVLPNRVKEASLLLKNSGVKVCTVISFPLGAEILTAKVYSARQALIEGAEELDLVININAIKDGNYNPVEAELKAVLGLKEKYDFILKVIVETALLTREELIKLTKMLSELNCDYIKTSTGFSNRGVSMEDIEIIRAHKSPGLKIKASGGIRTREFAKQLIELGVDRIGTSNAVGMLDVIPF